MTRKRFKKILMSYGYSRNEAEDASLYARSFYESYDDAISACLNFYRTRKMIKDFTNTVFVIGKAFTSVKDELANVVDSIIYSLQLRKDDANE